MRKIILAGVALVMIFMLGFGAAAYYCTYRVKVSANSPDNKSNEKEIIYVKDEKKTNEKEEDIEDEILLYKNRNKDKVEDGKNEPPSVTPKDDFAPLTVDVSTLSIEKKSWYFNPKKNGVPSGAPEEIKVLIKKYRGYYLGNIEDKTIYLTFDEGYENGYTGKILDVLRENNVKAAFFVTTTYINDNKELIKRMTDEGHMVCNHSTTHRSMDTIKDEESFNRELLECEKNFEKVTGIKMPKYFRPPMGEYSELSLYYTQKLKYKTIFWSFAYGDYEPDSQPAPEYAKALIMERTHGGGIYLLHAISKTNIEILDWLIKEWKDKGFQFKSLYEIQ